MSMNFFAFFPALANPQTNPNAAVTGYFANPPGPTGIHVAALGGQGVSIVSYSKKRDLAFKFLEWFIKDETQKKWAQLGGYTCSKVVLSSPEFLNATPYNQAFYDSMQIVRDFWATPEYAELLAQLNDNVYPYVVNNKGTADQALDGVVKDWTATFNKYHRYKN
jgi:multiple sugar transport system substrate-binding protein